MMQWRSARSRSILFRAQSAYRCETVGSRFSVVCAQSLTEIGVLQAPDQQSSSTAMEGYVGMESEMVAPSTLPATIMLPDLSRDSPRNVIVPTAVSASHVAFSAVGDLQTPLRHDRFESPKTLPRLSTVGPSGTYVDDAGECGWNNCHAWDPGRRRVIATIGGGTRGSRNEILCCRRS